MVISPDGATLIVAESFGNRLSAFPILADATLGPRRTFAAIGDEPVAGDPWQLPELVFAPDGICLDAEGAVWATDAIGQRVLRVADGGEVLETIPTAPSGVFACMLGGDDGRTLLVCLAPDFFEHARSVAREAVLATTTVDVPHAGLP